MCNQTVEFAGYAGIVERKRYKDGSPCIRLWTTHGEPLCTATVCLEGFKAPQGHAFIKDYSENEGILKALVDANIVADTDRRIPVWYDEVCVVRLVRP